MSYHSRIMLSFCGVLLILDHGSELFLCELSRQPWSSTGERL